MENLLIDLFIRVLVVLGLVVSGGAPAQQKEPVEEVIGKADR